MKIVELAKFLLAAFMTAFLVIGCASGGGVDETLKEEVTDSFASDEVFLEDPETDLSGEDIVAVDSFEDEISEGAGLEGYETTFYFDFDKSDITPEAAAALDSQIDALANTSGPIRLEGHTDSRGTREYNLALGERRAQSVADYLVFQGIPRSRIETVSLGEEQPVMDGENEEAWAANRRVELK